MKELTVYLELYCLVNGQNISSGVLVWALFTYCVKLICIERHHLESCSYTNKENHTKIIVTCMLHALSDLLIDFV